MENTIIANRLAALREVLRREKLDAFIFPSTDPHNSEYTPDRWKGRQWISGFDGSAGTAVVTADAAALWTDSRYFLAADDQLKGTEFQLMKLKVAGTPTIAEWLGTQLRDRNAQVGVDGMVNAESSVEALVTDLRRQGGITVRTNYDPLRDIWTDRPSVPDNKVVLGICRRVNFAEDRTCAQSSSPATRRRYAGVSARRGGMVAQPAW